jgi:hypothetical protein
VSTHPGQVLHYDAAGNVTGTTDWMVLYDETPERKPIGLVDFAAHEEAGGEMTDIFILGDPDTKGCKVWPEWLGGAAYDFRVELEGPAGKKRIKALVHKTSGYRRERADIEAAIAERIEAAGDGPADISDLVGGPDRPLLIGVDGKTKPRPAGPARPHLPVAGVKE